MRKVAVATRRKFPSFKGKKLSPSTKAKISVAKQGCPSWNKNLKTPQKTKMKLSDVIGQLWKDSEYRARQSQAHLGHIPPNKGQTYSCLQISKKLKSLWKKEEFIRKQMRARNVKPNKLEKRIESLLDVYFPSNWKFVGDGSVIIGSLSPDFINCNGKKLLIEVFGNYWHSPDEVEQRSKTFSEYGFATLVIWEEELNRLSENEIVNEVKSFSEQ